MTPTISKLNEQLAFFTSLRDNKRKQYRDLVDRYSGVRPGWVSADLTFIGMEITSAENRITEIEEILSERMNDEN